jgi:4-hydroxy-3-methylbut-2-en-1-yl diphosphate reductase
MTTPTPTPHDPFASDIVNAIRAAHNVHPCPGGRVLLPSVFGFCRGVRRALTMAQQALAARRDGPGRLCLLGEIIHNPWVNDFFRQRGVTILDRPAWDHLETTLTRDDCAIIPAFGVPLAVEQQLETIGCEIIDTSCGDVRRLWRWASRAAQDGCAIVIYGKANHDETIVTRSRLEAVGGQYVVVATLEQTRTLCELLSRGAPVDAFVEALGADAVHLTDPAAFARTAQVSQTTMLYEDTLEVRRLLTDALGAEHLQFEPTVCQATQDRQQAARDLCDTGADLILVVGGFGSSNSRHLYELARRRTTAWFIEDASAFEPDGSIRAFDETTHAPRVVTEWLPTGRPITIGVLAGASSPEIVVGQVVERLVAHLN